MEKNEKIVIELYDDSSPSYPCTYTWFKSTCSAEVNRSDNTSSYANPQVETIDMFFDYIESDFNNYFRILDWGSLTQQIRMYVEGRGNYKFTITSDRKLTVNK